MEAAPSYLVLGAGRQGTAAAFDLARNRDTVRVTLADSDGERARQAALRVNGLLGTSTADSCVLDVRDGAAVARALRGYTVAVSAVPYYFNLPLTRAAIESGVSFCDLGGNTEIVRQQHALDAAARSAGVRVIPDCGMGPGLGNNLAVYAMGLLDEADHVHLYDGGLPKEPQPPWNYALSFSVAGLTNEYHGGMTILRQGKLEHVPCFTELEEIDFPSIGRLEAFFVAGGCSTAPWTFQGKLQSYQLKILRYPGTFAQLKAFSDLGLFEQEPVDVAGARISPREVFHALFAPQVTPEVVKDVCIFRARVLGRKGGAAAEAVVDVVDECDETTGFSAMERTTGWHLSIVAAMMARGETPPGAIPLELAVRADHLLREVKARGFRIREEIRANEPS